jgi:hypothetical protein
MSTLTVGAGVMSQARVGMKVVRGDDWKWKDQDKGGTGVVAKPAKNGWVAVKWQHGATNSYRCGDGKFDLRMAGSSKRDLPFGMSPFGAGPPGLTPFGSPPPSLLMPPAEKVPPSFSLGPSGVPKCPAGHLLKPDSADNGWACDGRHLPNGCVRGCTGFRQSSGWGRFRCAACDFDLCDLCVEKLQERGAKERLISRYSESYFCEVTGLQVSDNVASVSIHVRGDGKLGPLQDPAKSTLQTMEGKEFAVSESSMSTNTVMEIVGVLSYPVGADETGPFQFSFGSSGYSVADLSDCPALATVPNAKSGPDQELEPEPEPELEPEPDEPDVGSSAAALPACGKEQAWIDLSDSERSAAESLGWDEQMWSRGDSPETSTVYWDQLSAVQRESGELLGYDQASWDAEVAEATTAQGGSAPAAAAAAADSDAPTYNETPDSGAAAPASPVYRPTSPSDSPTSPDAPEPQSLDEPGSDQLDSPEGVPPPALVTKFAGEMTLFQAFLKVQSSAAASGSAPPGPSALLRSSYMVEFDVGVVPTEDEASSAQDTDAATSDDMLLAAPASSGLLEKSLSATTIAGDGIGNLTRDFADDETFMQAIALLVALYRDPVVRASVPENVWVNSRMSNKLHEQLGDAVAIVCGTLPSWCSVLPRGARFLFRFPVRLALLECAFGASRTVHRVQQLAAGSRSDAAAAAQRGQPAPRVGTLLHERIVMPREPFLAHAEMLMSEHASRKTVLEVEIGSAGEKGTGEGVHAEFYTVAAGALTTRVHNQTTGMWIPDMPAADTEHLLNPIGLFPAALPQSCSEEAIALVKRKFLFLGRLFGKALMDNRTIPMPLHPLFIDAALGRAPGVADLGTILSSKSPGVIVRDCLEIAAACTAVGDKETSAACLSKLAATPVRDICKHTTSTMSVQEYLVCHFAYCTFPVPVSCLNCLCGYLLLWLVGSC